MGGLGPGIGGLEILVIGVVALLVVGPKDLPMLMRKVGKAMGKARAMAAEFRSSFDEMARQSELDELRKEVEALRQGQGLVPLGAEAEATFRDIKADLNTPLDAKKAKPPALSKTPEPAPADPEVAELEAEPAPVMRKRATAKTAQPKTTRPASKAETSAAPRRKAPAKRSPKVDP